MEKFSYAMPTRIIFGCGEFSRAGEIASQYKPKKVLVVTGKNSMRKFGFTQKLTRQLTGSGAEVVEYNKISPNPPEGEVDEGAELCRKEKVDLVIALGGGSAMDAGKAIAALAENGGKTGEYMLGKREFSRKALPCICIPTTSGTSSEITRYAVITTEGATAGGRKKKGIASDFLYADVALIDPELAKTMTPEITAATGLDALSHAVEAYWNTDSEPISRHSALKAIELVSKNLLNAYKDKSGSDMAARTNMSLATIFAGFAFNNPGTTSLHAVSYYLTTHFGLPHGSACAITMPAFMRFNAEKEKRLLQDIAVAMGCASAEEAAQSVERLMREMKAPARLHEIGATEKDLDAIVRDAMRPNMLRNPRRVDERALKKLLGGIL